MLSAVFITETLGGVSPRRLRNGFAARLSGPTMAFKRSAPAIRGFMVILSYLQTVYATMAAGSPRASSVRLGSGASQGGCHHGCPAHDERDGRVRATSKLNIIPLSVCSAT